MSMDLIKELASPFKTLFIDHDFKEVGIVYKPEEFGNASLIMNSSDLSIRFLRDRGNIMIDVGPPSANSWHKLEYLLEFVDSSIKAEDFGTPPDLTRLAIGLTKNYSKVKQILNSSLADSGYERFERDKKNSLIAQIFGTDCGKIVSE